MDIHPRYSVWKSCEDQMFIFYTVHFLQICGCCLTASVFPLIFFALYYSELVILIKESEISVTYLTIIQL